MVQHTIWITRPTADATELAYTLEQAGHHVLRAPLLDIVPEPEVDTSALSTAHTLLLTSANGVRALANLTNERDMQMICVGDFSAVTARELGFTQVESATTDGVSNSELLTDYVCTHVTPDSGALLHVSGSDVAGHLVQSLTEHGYDIARLICYRAVPVTTLPNIDSATIVLFYSMRSAATGTMLLKEQGADMTGLTAICLSDQVSRIARAAAFRAVHTLAGPDPQNLLSLLEKIE